MVILKARPVGRAFAFAQLPLRLPQGCWNSRRHCALANRLPFAGDLIDGEETEI
jgi:hypothetical protein